MPADPDPGPQHGDMLDGKYVLRDRIGRGGMSSVFLADQPALERTVAIKVLHAELARNPAGARQVHVEAVAASRVRSPHCVGVIDCGALPDGTPYIVMEYVPGRALGRILAEQDIPLARAVELFEQVLSALGAIHGSGIVHGDVKSENIMVEQIGGAEHVTLIDFGLARIAGEPVRSDPEPGVTMIVGTPEYMAPELTRGEPTTHASDLYAAGVILYELLTGTTPFGGGAAIEIAVRHVHEAVVAPSRHRPDRDIPAAFDDLVLRALDKRPEARFPDAATFARELRAAARLSRMEPWTRARGAAKARRGTTPSSDGGSQDRVEALKQLRCVIVEALACRDAEQVADGYLAISQMLIRERRYAAAAYQLEEAIELLTSGRGSKSADRPAPVDHLAAVLATLYESGAANNAGASRRSA